VLRLRHKSKGGLNMRKYYYELSKDKSIIIGDTWGKDGKLNQLGYIAKREDSVVYLDFEFKLPNGLVVKKERVMVDEFLGDVSEYLTKDDLVGLCGFLYLWGK
jgi:hypothetical protein